MQLFTIQEIQAILALLNRTPMSPAEQLFAQGFFQRLVAFCTPPKPEPEDIKPGPKEDLTEEQARAIAYGVAMAEVLDEADEE